MIKITNIVFSIIFSVLIILSISFVHGDVLDQYYLPDSASLSVVDAIYQGKQVVCQEFTPSSSDYITTIRFPFKRAAAAVGQYCIRLYNSTGTEPDKKISQACYVDSGNGTLTGSFAYYNYSIPSVFLTSGNLYYACGQNTEPTNYIHIYINASNPYLSGNVFRDSSDSGSWVESANVDMPFGIYMLGLPSLNINTNLINNTINYNENNLPIYYNGSFGGVVSTDLFNCSFYANGILNTTQSNVNLSNNQFINFSVYYTEKNYTFNISCNNFETNDTTITYYYKVDTIDPIIESSFVNGSTYYVGDSISAYFNFTDTNLIAYNVTWFDINGDSDLIIFATNLTSTYAENISSRVQTIIGNYTLRAQVWDSHTKKNIPNYIWNEEIRDNGLKKGFLIDGIFIYTEDSSLIKSTLLKHNDRYIFNFKLKENRKYDFYIEAENIIYLPYSEYKGHFVVNYKHWVDFVSNDIKELKIQKYGNLYKISFITLKDNIMFNSIGDLNYVEKIYNYEVVAAPSVLSSTINLTGLEMVGHKINSNFRVMVYFFIMIGFLFVGILSRYYITWILSGLIAFWLGIITMVDYLTTLQTGDLYSGLFFTMIGFMFIIVGIILTMKEGRDKAKPRDFYHINY